MKKTFKYRIFPTKKQETLLKKQLEECRWLYNHFVAERNNSYEQTGKAPSHYDQQNTIPALKVQRESLIIVHSQTLQNVSVRVDLAFQAYFRRVRSGEKEVGYPRFKGYGRYDILTFSQVPSGCKLDNNRVVISKVGHLKVKLHRPMRGQAKTCVITRSSTAKWYACFSCDNVEPVVLPPNSKRVGIDVGLKTFASMSDGTEIANPRFFRKEEETLGKAQRKVSKATKGTPERRKNRKVVARTHERIAWFRTNFSHQESRKIVNANGFIAVEDLHINQMSRNHKLSKSIHDAAWSNLFSMLRSKAEEAGYIFIAVNPAYTSQTCSNCGTRLLDKLTLSDRVFNCPDCKLSLDRDYNASLNILALGLQGHGVSLIDAPAFTPGE